MTIFDLTAGAVLLGAVFYLLASAFRNGEVHIPWIAPAVLFVAFTIFSVSTVLIEGPIGFWANHTDTLWGLQVWMDLLFSVAIAWTFLVPEAKRQDMPVLPWGIFVACTASIGLWAMMARVLYLKQLNTAPHTA